MEKKYLFGTSGIRGAVDTLFTEQFCLDLISSFVEFLKKHKYWGPVAIGMDPRSSGPLIKERLVRGLSRYKAEIFDEGVSPIPSMNWLIKNTQIPAAIMITGSHIAKELNGVKFYAHDEEISYEDQLEINDIYWKVRGKAKGLGQKPDIHLENRAKDLYSDMLLAKADEPYPNWKVAVDCANGAQSVVMPDLLSELGTKVVKINCDVQSDFIARDTDTDDQARIEDLKKTVVSEKCDLGIAFDGDGDRVIFIDENGKFVQGEYSCSLIAQTLPGETLITPISSSQVVESIGKKVIRTKVGSPYVVGAMKEHKANFGFEPNGGAVFADTMYTRDGGNMTIHMLNLFSKKKGKFSEMFSELPKYYMMRTKVEYDWDLKEKILEEAEKQFKGIKVEKLDGLKIWMDNATWILFRSSANAPEFRVFAESDKEEKAKKLLEDGINFVKKIIGKNG